MSCYFCFHWQMWFFLFLSIHFMVIKIGINQCQMSFVFWIWWQKEQIDLVQYWKSFIIMTTKFKIINHYWRRKKIPMEFSHVTGLGFSGHFCYKLQSLWTFRSHHFDLWWANPEMSDHLYLHVPMLVSACTHASYWQAQ